MAEEAESAVDFMATIPNSFSPFPQVNGNGQIHRSATLGKLVAALAKAQLEFKSVVKDAENAAFTRGTKKSMYATLDSVISATRDPLAKHGLTIIALPQEMVDDKRLRMTSVLIHESDEFIESTLTMTAVDRVTPHEIGKLITYCRKYQWSSLTGVAPEDDSDGNEASGVGSREAAQDVAKRKLEDAGVVPSLFFVWHDESQTAEITGSADLKTKNRDLLGKFWNAAVGQIVVNAEQLDGLKYEFNKRGIPFTRLQSPDSLEDKLKDSVKAAKSKKEKADAQQ